MGKSASQACRAILFFYIAVTCVLLVIPLTTFAQGLDIKSVVELTTTPTDPLPNSNLTVSLSAYTVSASGASIRWYIDGTEVADSREAREITLETGPIGSSQIVRAVITPANGSNITAEKQIRPSQVDLIIEADTRVPNFYKGRPLPVGDEPIVATAIPHVNSGAAPESLTYTWKLGDAVLFGGPVRGRYQVSFSMPKSSTLLGVIVTDNNGNRVGGINMSLIPAAPELHFYEDNPLRSTSHQALGDSFTLVGDEVTVRAEPYFIASDIFTSNPVLKWTLDGREIQNFGNDPQNITLRGAGGSGDSRVGFQIVNQESLLQFLQDSFTIHFES